ncbi:hypothetical protein BKH23_13425 [Actinomyces oris]|nr:hypothetical protein BKH23_13425 [Actinomyces oris]
MTSETLVRTGVRGRLVVLKTAMRGGKRAGRSLVSMVLTSQAHRRCTPRTNRRIPTISAGCFGGWIVDVSAVDTGPRGSESAGFLVAQPGASVTGPPPARCLRGVRRSWFDAGSAPSRPTPRGSGSTDHGLCVLHEGPTYPKYPQPSSSSTPPSCSAPKRRQQAPEQLRAAGPAPPEKRAVAPAHGRPTPPAS